MEWTAEDILIATAGERICGDRHARFSGIAIDSRKISASACFVAIRGEIHDGHRFCADVVQAGVRGLLIDFSSMANLPVDAWRQQEMVCIAVSDTTRALGDLAAWHRRRFPVSVAAITGSNGKTTTRTMTSDILARRFQVLSTAGNFNNHIGLPLTLLNLNNRHEWAVVELGMNHSGEIERLSEICRPNIGVITMVGTAHLENFASPAGILDAKAEIFSHLSPNGRAILNMDDPKLVALSRRLSVPVTFFGWNPDADIRAGQVQTHAAGTSFILGIPTESIEISLPTAGTFMVSNALAAAAVGTLLGVTGSDIKKALEGFTPIKGRMNVVETGRQIHLIDDTYNANPASMNAAIQTLEKIKGEQRGILVIGDMLELGKDSAEVHRHIGGLAQNCGVVAIYATGRYAEDVARGATDEGMDTERVFIGDKNAICDRLKNCLREGDWVLVKGSRSMRMEKIVQDILSWAGSIDGGASMADASQ